jgi:DNA-binding Lrp family transcriptional regulator
MEKIDETDLNILRILQKDSKKTTKEIAEILNLTASPVYEIIKRLEKHKLIKKYVALIDKKKLNISITVLCMG